jgi:RimJ/RimL family protein N-acetyltransferase
LPSDRLRESMLLEESGFRFVEMVYRPALRPLPVFDASGESVVVGEASPGDLPGIESIAGSAFTTGRFFVDWRLDRDASNRRYRRWVRNSFDDAQHRVLKATLDGDLVGFFIVEHRPDRSVYWHLTAIAPAWQGRGLGKRLWHAMVARHRAEGVERIDTTISAHNAPAMNIYARLGFNFTAPQMTFHWRSSRP